MTRITASDGVALACRIDGPTEAPALILGNSLGTDMRLYDGQWPGLAQRYRVVRIDTRGHGRSDAPPGVGTGNSPRPNRSVMNIRDVAPLPASRKNMR